MSHRLPPTAIAEHALESERLPTGLPRGGVDWGRLQRLTSFNMRLTLSYMMSAWFRHAGALGLKPSEFAVLALVEANPKISAVSLANALNIALPNVVALIGKLSKEGMLDRQPDPLDRRCQQLTLTDAGLQRVAAVGQAVQAADESVIRKLSPGDLRELNQLMTDLRS